MSIEQANAAALKASMAGDLEALKRALAERAAAIAELLREEPSGKLLSRVRNAINAGDFIGQDLRALKGRMAEGAPHFDLQG